MIQEERPLYLICVTVLLCCVCAGLVSSSVVLLRPLQERQQELDRKRKILVTAGLASSELSEQAVLERFAEQVRPHELFSQDPPVRRTIYQIYQQNQLKASVLPIEGKGLWSTLYGYLAVQADGTTLIGLQFYQHGETPGLGGEVDNPQWLSLWSGKKIYDAQGSYRLQLLKGRVDPRNGALVQHQIDGLSGATLTTQGIDRFLRSWLGPKGYGAYLQSAASSKERPSHEP